MAATSSKQQPAAAAASRRPTASQAALSLSSSSSLSAGANSLSGGGGSGAQQPSATAQAAATTPPAASKPHAQQKISSPNLLSPNVAVEAGAQQQCRRKSTLSANGFFIDYSCTRRRSSAASQQQHQQQARALDPLAKSQFLRQVISPTGARRPSMAPPPPVAGRESFSAPSTSWGAASAAGATSGPRVNSRASYSSGPALSSNSPAPSNHLLRPPGGAQANFAGGRHSVSSAMGLGLGLGGLAGGSGARSLAGSRKTSIFDPAGHSLLAAANDPRRRRKSTMVAGGGGGAIPAALEQAATMLAVSRQAAAVRRDRQLGGGGTGAVGQAQRLAQRVPVFGCSPTSICASLAALDETRRYEKLLRKLEGHQARRARERKKLERAKERELMCDIDLESYGEEEEESSFSCDSATTASDHTEDLSQTSRSSGGSGTSETTNHHQHQTVGGLLRRKSQRAIRDVGLLLGRVAQAQRKRRRRRKRRWRLGPAGAWRKSHGAGDPFVDGLSISSTLSFVSSQTSLHSMERLLEGLSLEAAAAAAAAAVSGYSDCSDGSSSSASSSESDASGPTSSSSGGGSGASHESEPTTMLAACHSEGHLGRAGKKRRADGADGVDHTKHHHNHHHQRPLCASAERVDRRHGRQKRQWRGRQDEQRRQREMTLGSALDLSSVGNNNERRPHTEQRDHSDRDLHHSAQSPGVVVATPVATAAAAKSSLVRRAMRRIAATLATRGGGADVKHGRRKQPTDTGSPSRGPPMIGLDGGGSGGASPRASASGTTNKIATTTASHTKTSAPDHRDNESRGQTAARPAGRPRLTMTAGQQNNGGESTAAATLTPHDDGNKAPRHQRHRHHTRRRSVSMAAGLNYWHYYYYLRNNSLDELELPAGALGGVCGAASASALYPAGGGRSGFSDSGGRLLAAAAAASAAGGAPMGESERRTRLYVNYSLARLEILNCRTDPVARLAAKLEAQQHQQQQQQQRRENAETLGQPAANQVEQSREFEFTTTDNGAAPSSDSDECGGGSLSLSTSSTNLASSDTSRNSSSLSSRGAPSSSSSECSLVSGATMGPPDGVNAPCGTASTTPTNININNNTTARANSMAQRPTNRRELPAVPVRVLGRPDDMPQQPLGSSLLSSSSRSSLATVRDLAHQRATSGAPWQPSVTSTADCWLASNADGCDYLAQCNHPSPGPGQSGGACEGAEAPYASSPHHHFARDAHFRFSVRASSGAAAAARSSVSSASLSSRQSSAGEASAGAWPAAAHDTGHPPLSPQVGPHGASLFPFPPPGSPAHAQQQQQAAAYRAHQHQQPQLQPVRQFMSAGGPMAPVAPAQSAPSDQHRRSRTFLSWDRLEQQGAQSGCRPLQAIKSGLAASSVQVDATAAVRPRGRLLSRGLGGSSESTSSSTLVGGGGGMAAPVASRTASVCRRSFKQLRGADGAAQQSAGASTSSPTGTRRWCSSSIVSRSKSFLFQRRSSSKQRHAEPLDNNDKLPQHQQQKRPVAAQQQQRDEQRVAANKLLEQFEAQMSEAANLAHEQQQQREQADLHAPGNHARRQQQQTECKSRANLQSPRRSTASSSPTSSLETAAAAAAAACSAHNQRLARDMHNQHQRQQQQQHEQNQQQQHEHELEAQTMRKSALCLNGVGQGEAAGRPLQARARSSMSLLGGGGGVSGGEPLCSPSHQLASQAPPLLQVANQRQQRQYEHLTGGGANDAPPPFSPVGTIGQQQQRQQPMPLGRYASDISLQRQQLWQQQQREQQATGTSSQAQESFNRSTGGTTASSGTNQNSFESATGGAACGSGERLYGAREDLARASSSSVAARDEGLRARAHSTGAGAGAFANELTSLRAEQQQQQQQRLRHQLLLVAETAAARPQQQQRHCDNANSAHALARRTSREPQLHVLLQQHQQQDEQQQQQLRAISNESALGAQHALRTSPGSRASSAGQAQQRAAPASPRGQAAPATSTAATNFPVPNKHERRQEAPQMRLPVASGNGAAAAHSLQAQAVSLLRKSAFTCTVLGARQTGKRTIVICFVKLLNEFKLAADECKKEEMLTKLVECSERLQELTSRAEEQQAAAEEEAARGSGGRQRRTSRLNSWLPGGASGGVRHLLNLSPVSAKRRLHSVVNPLLGVSRQKEQSHSSVNLSVGDGGAEDSQVASSLLVGGPHQQQQRRHTTFEPATTSSSSGARLSAAAERQQGATSGSGGPGGQRHLPLAGHARDANKSDSNINYCQSSGAAVGNNQNQHSLAETNTNTNQLQVPSLDAAMLRKHSDPTCGGSGRSQNQQQQHHHRLSTQSPGSVFLHEGGEGVPVGASGQRRRHTTTNFCDTAGRPLPPLRSEAETHDTANRQRCGGGSRRPAANGPRQSISLSRRSRRILLSLKELNRRRFAIRFSARRVISEGLVAQIRANAAEAQRAAAAAGARGRRRSTIMQLTGGGLAGTSGECGGGGSGGPGERTDAPPLLPDSFLVIYSINDRDSFEYAKSLVEQLRELAGQQAQEIPLPIVLVANKSDLERNREVKREDGRAVAKKFACKFIEISCTIGFNLDNLLVGLRTQLVLKHHIVLNSILRPGFRYKARYLNNAGTKQRDNKTTTTTTTQRDNGREVACKDKRTAAAANKGATSDNILVRLCKRYVMDTSGNDYDCDNFSKL